MPRQQDDEQFVDMPFPVRGLDVSRAFGLQLPQTTPVGVNVRAFDPLTSRARGGQWPGLARYGPVLLGGGLIQDLACIVGVGYTAPAPSSGPYVAQAGAGAAGTGTTTVDSFTSSVTAGSSVLVIAGSVDGSRAYPNSISDGSSNTYTRIDNSSVSNTAVSFWLASNVTGGFTAVTGHWNSGSGRVQIVAYELAGASAANTGSDPTGVGTTGTGVNFTTTAAPLLVFVGIQANQTVTRTGGSYFDLHTGDTLYTGFKFVPANVTTGADLTLAFGANSFWAGCMKGIK